MLMTKVLRSINNCPSLWSINNCVTGSFCPISHSDCVVTSCYWLSGRSWQLVHCFHPHGKSDIIFSSVCFVYLSVCLSVSTVTPEPLKISTQNFQGITLWLKGRTSLKMAYPNPNPNPRYCSLIPKQVLLKSGSGRIWVAKSGQVQFRTDLK